MAELRVLLATSDNSITSGAFRSTAYLASELVQLGCDCRIVVPQSGAGDALIESLGVDRRTIRSYGWVRSIGDESFGTEAKWLAKRAFNHLHAVPAMKRLIAEESIDLVHLCTSYTYVPALAARQLGLPYVWHIREFLEEDQRRRISSGEHWFELMSSAARVIAISDAIEAKYSAILRPTPVTRIYNGISSADFGRRDRDPLAGAEVKMVMVGSIQERKGQLELVKALGLLPEELRSACRVSLFGKALSAAYRAQVEEEIRAKGLSGIVSLPGPTDDPASAFLDADVAFVCSRSEAFGRVTVEAMMAGCVVIGADSMGTAEIIDDAATGYLYEQGSPEALARRILDVLGDRATARRIARQGQRKALHEFTARRNAEEVARVYEEVLAARRGGAPGRAGR